MSCPYKNTKDDKVLKDEKIIDNKKDEKIIDHKKDDKIIDHKKDDKEIKSDDNKKEYEQNPKGIDYASYLQLDKLLSAQLPESSKDPSLKKPAHEELLFIIIHQTYELWFKEILHEIDSIQILLKHNNILGDEIFKIVHRLGRIIEIQKVLIGQIDILETMTSHEFLNFRDYLYPASGFQSYQFRMVEVKLGLKQNKRLKYDRKDYTEYLVCPQKNILIDLEGELSVLELLNIWLERCPYLENDELKWNFWDEYIASSKQMFTNKINLIKKYKTWTDKDKEEHIKQLEKERDGFLESLDEKSHQERIKKGKQQLTWRAVQAAVFINVYADQPILQMPSKLIDSLINIDGLMEGWRNRHALMVHKMLGWKVGTGGSSGYLYLKGTASRHKIFTDLFNISVYLIPRDASPDLPKGLLPDNAHLNKK